jgi:hypothetical protein
MKNKISVDEMITARDLLEREISFQKEIIRYGDNGSAYAAVDRMPGLLKRLYDLNKEIEEHKISAMDYAMALLKWW